MSDATFLTEARAVGRPAGRPRVRLALLPLAVLGASLLSGCVGSDHVIVGAIPDDYRTSHPIVISQNEQVTDIPVGAGDRAMTRSQRQQLEGFLSGYDRAAAPVVQFLLPAGSANATAARKASAGLVQVARENGVQRSRIAVLSYDAGQAEAQPPIRVVYSKVTASAGPCGRWPEDILASDVENKHYADFGCSYQHNLAAQVANPADLIGPRKEGDIDATNRGQVITLYRNRGVSPEFTGNSEVNY
jgi:pilus assembly protein CpaD